MKLKLKINLKESRIPEWIKVPKTLIEAKPWKHKLINFVEKQYLKETFNFQYDEENKILTSIDDHPKVIHGIYSKLNLKLTKEVHDRMYTHGWFTGFEGRFVGHDVLFRHFVTFDENNVVDVVKYYLENPDERIKIQNNMHEYWKNNYTAKHFWDNIFRIYNRSL